MSLNNLLSITPIDGRYTKATKSLDQYFSEYALIRYRVFIECEYFLELSRYQTFSINLTDEQKEQIKALHLNFSLEDAQNIKEKESITNHDVKAVEYWIKEKFDQIGITQYKEFVHFALTSEDVNNLSFTLMQKNGLAEGLIPVLQNLIYKLTDLAKTHADQPMLSLTHGQSATPTTFGKEIAVYVYRLKKQLQKLNGISYYAKFGGATGTWSAHTAAYPQFDWLNFANNFTEKFDLEFNPLTTQIVPADSLAESYHTIIRINSILIDFSRDIWMYVMRGILGQKKVEGEVGSSAMPHKINPINFENAEGNLSLANSTFEHLARELPISRMQRDLTGSTVIRNQGVPVAHSLIAYQNLIKGIDRVSVNSVNMNKELESNQQVLAEAIQTILRKLNYPNPYETLKALTRGQEITPETLGEFVENLDIPDNEKTKIKNLTAKDYIGISSELVDFILNKKQNSNS